ncbi:unnamed protein product [Gongylonema pulchrum]|uniref:Uncharacterized protein n=1 Tax=Gongylonema pulchrum TaxID=637853 RepID=A0A183DXM8_9BILA|nr:unnamed protein product [Gongylonema pulchrum]
MTPNEPVLTPASLLAKFQESPSTATLKFRKQPFLRVDYAIQACVTAFFAHSTLKLSLGDRLLLELPITILPLPWRGNGIVYQPFVGGAQPIPESDESGKFIYGDGFMFTPQYCVASSAAVATTALHSNGSTENECITRSNGNPENGAKH